MPFTPLGQGLSQLLMDYVVTNNPNTPKPGKKAAFKNQPEIHRILEFWNIEYIKKEDSNMEESFIRENEM